MLQVRRCDPKDLNEVYLLVEKYTSFDAVPTRADIEGLYERNPEFFFVVESESNRIIGFITGYEKKEVPEQVLQTWKASRVGYVDLMAVDLPYRRRGAGTLLLNTLLKQFQESSIDIVLLDVPAEQGPAVSMYKKLGFQVRAYNMAKVLK
jgi:ribosomal protein S18 acetylase RimI-like enzyme